MYCCIAHSSILNHSLKIGRTTFGWDVDPEGHANALKEVKEQLKILNNALNLKDFLVSNRFTLADVAVFVALYIPFTMALDAGFRKNMPHVSAWFERVAKRPEVLKIVGHVHLPSKAMKPATA